MKRRATDLAKYRRIVEIYAYLIRNQSRQYTVADIRKFLEEGGDATLDISARNVQRDLKDLADIPNTCVEAKWEKGRLYYFIEADMRRKLSLPIQQNGLLAFFLLKRLQPFFARKTKSLDDLSEKIADLEAMQITISLKTSTKSSKDRPFCSAVSRRSLSTARCLMSF